MTLSNRFCSKLPAMSGCRSSQSQLPMLSRHRINAREVGPPASLHEWLPFTLFQARGINFSIVVYFVRVHVEVDLH